MRTEASPAHDRGSLSRDLIRYFPAKVVPALLGFLIIVLLSRRLTTGAYGSYAALLAIARIADSLCFAWLRQGILRFHPELAARGEETEFRRSLSFLVVLIVGVEAVAVFLFSLGLEHGLARASLATALVVSMTPYTFVTTVVQAERAAGAYAVAAVIQSGVQAAWVAAFVFLMDQGEAWALLGVVAGLVGGTAYLVRAAPRAWPLPRARLDRERTRALFAYGFPVALAVLGLQLVNQGNRVLLYALGSAEAAGVYSSAFDLINGSLSLLMTPFLLASHPAIMQARLLGERARESVEAILRGVARHLFMLFLPVLFLSAVLRHDVFLVLGPGYGVEGWVVPVLVAGAFLGQLAMYAHKGLEIADRTRAILEITLVVGAVNLVSNALLIPRYSYFAVAVVSLCTYSAYVVIASMLSRDHATLRVPWKCVGRFAATAAGAGVGFYAVRGGVAALGVAPLAASACGATAFGIAYVAALIRFGDLPSPGAIRAEWPRPLGVRERGVSP